MTHEKISQHRGKGRAHCHPINLIKKRTLEQEMCLSSSKIKKISELSFCQLAFSSFKIRNMFSVKDPVPVELCSNVVYKFTCASCNSCYVGETSRHLSTPIREHLKRDRTSHIFQHIQQSEACRNSCSAECFEVIDHATTKFQVKIKEALAYLLRATFFKQAIISC